NDPVYLQQAMALIFLIAGASLLIPLDGRSMLLAGLIPLGLQIALTWDYPLSANLPTVVSVFTAVMVAAVGSQSSHIARLGEFEGRKAKEDLLRARTDFVAMLTHDIKNPLGVIAGFAELVCQEEDLSPSGRDNMNQIQAATRKALMLAMNFLDASTIESDRLALQPGAVDVRRLLDRTIDFQRCLADVKKIGISVESDRLLPPVRGDEMLLDRAIGNLLSNAIKFTPHGGSIRIVARRSGGRAIEVAVEDSGGGIPREERARLFEPYRRGASRTDSSGLGLYIVKKIVEAHGGEVAPEDRSDADGGACFRMTLPVA
ncbi:MAG: sensor histidine kinase, partial [Candidatus Binatia bacterium]